jgi:hypothetical protein
VYLDNAYRRLKLRLNKTSTNLLEIGIDQFTQVAGITENPDPESWTPQSLRAFLRDYTLHLSLSSILVIDISGAINSILGAIINAILNAAFPGVGGIIGSAVSSIITPLLSDWLAGVIGDATGYGNPLRVGQIVDDLVGKGAGGIPLAYLYIPDLLSTLLTLPATDPEPYNYGSLYGRITGGDDVEVNVEGATVQLYLAGTLYYSTTTDKDGKYAFINLVAGQTYEVRIVAPTTNVYNSYPQAHEAAIYATVMPFREYPATEFNHHLAPYGEYNYGPIIISGYILDASSGTGTVPLANAQVYFTYPSTSSADLKLIGTTDGNGYYYWEATEDVFGYAHIIEVRHASKATYTTYLYLNSTISNYTWNYTYPYVPIPPITSGTITITLQAMEDQPLFTGNSTETFGTFATDNGAAYPEATLTDIHTRLSNNYLGAAIRNGNGTLVGAQVVSGIHTMTYTYPSTLAMHAAIENFIDPDNTNSFLMQEVAGTSPAFVITENIEYIFYHAVSYSRQVIIEARAIPSKNMIIVGVMKGIIKAVDDNDVEVWLEYNGRTIRHTDSFNGNVDQLYYNVTDITDYAKNLTGPEADGEEDNGYWDSIFYPYHQNQPRDYTAQGRAMDASGNLYDTKVYNIDKTAADIMVDGVLKLEKMPLNRAYTVKIRSKLYQNVDKDTFTLTVADNTAEGTYTLYRRAPHWSEEPAVASSMIQGIRIRLGADYLDASSDDPGLQDVTNPGYTEDGIPLTYANCVNKMGEDVINASINWAAGQAVGAAASWLGNLVGGGIGGSIVEWLVKQGGNAAVGAIPDADLTSSTVDEKGKTRFVPWINYTNGYQEGPYDANDAVSYIEIWLAPNFIGDLLGMVNNLLYNMIGYGDITPDQRYLPRDLAAIPEDTSETKIQRLKFDGIFDESDDEKVFDYIYDTREDFQKVMYEAGPRQAGGLVNFLLSFVFTQVMSGGIADTLNSSTAMDAIQFVFGIELVDDILDQATRLISHLFPLTLPYSMIEEKDLENSPLQAEDVPSTIVELDGVPDSSFVENVEISGKTYGPERYQKLTNVKDLLAHQGALEAGTRLVGSNDKDGDVLVPTDPTVDDEGELTTGYEREHDFHDMSVYAKVFLNANFNNLFERILLFINGASYLHSRNLLDPSKADEQPELAYGYGQITPENWFITKGTILRADSVMFDEDGFPLPEYQDVYAMIQRWIKTNVVNSYILINDYEYTQDTQGVVTKKLIGTTYVRDVYGHFDEEDFLNGIPDSYMYVAEDGDVVEHYEYRTRTEAEITAVGLVSAKDDRYLELDIYNTGLRLRAVTNIGGEYFSPYNNGTNYMGKTYLTPPNEIIFHDPYNIMAFTAIGGSWAGEEGYGGVRSNLNEDGTYTVSSLAEILPKRNMVGFADGDSSEGAGAMMYWDLSRLDMTPRTDSSTGYIVGYAGNQIYGWNDVLKKVTKIPARVESGMIIDPNSTLHITEAEPGTTDNIGGYVQDLTNTSKAIDLPEINPLTFDETEYRKLLPTIIDYAAKYQQVDAQLGTAKVFTNAYGWTQDYLYKRYVFNNL